ncbi:MAG: hypothetical protein sL5_11160 [Candidatus Mesenet longicola]|uniref:Uncharacterized protein n=1 Tax=Candidatus Mesenet longicola TaxID=1892558 RepID=A0A8J3MPJ7_9RICK|nr:MAG: hypothetical protein sGL2_11570 [Candidatus Mesenet longicola]GHM60123.1 MAG: hypothetical protein sL5_11160 [Candidatus Mesenet longicola]
MEELIERFRGYKNRPEFSQLDITGITESSPTESTITEKAALTESLNSIKNKTKSITDTLKEIGTVSPGSGLMPEQKVCYPKRPYFSSQEYINIINNFIEKKLEKFENELSFKAEKFYEYSNVYAGFSRFEITDTAGNTMKVSYLAESKRWNLKVNDEILTFECGQSQSRAFEIITKYVYNKVYTKKSGNSTKVKLESCKPLKKIDFLTSLTEIPTAIGYRHYFTDGLSHKKPVNNSPSPFNCSFKPIDVAAGLTIFGTILASLLTNTTPAIGYNNSTNTSITNTNLSATTSKPEQDVDEGGISAGAIDAIVAGTGVIILCFICYCCYRKKRHNGKCYINEKGQEEGISLVATETQSQSSENDQPSTYTIGEMIISDANITEIQKALDGKCTSFGQERKALISSEQREVKVRAEPSTSSQHTQGDGSQNPQCSGDGSTVGMLKSNTLFKKQVEANNKSQETPKSGEQLESELDNAIQTLEMLKNGLQSNQLIGAASKVAQATIELADKAKAVVSPSNEGANSLLQAIQVESPAQQASR